MKPLAAKNKSDTIIEILSAYNNEVANFKEEFNL